MKWESFNFLNDILTLLKATSDEDSFIWFPTNKNVLHVGIYILN